MALPKLTRLELQIMEALWNLGPSSIREIQEAFPEPGRPAYTTIQTTVYRLEAKKALRRVKKISNAHIFEAVLSRNAAQSRLIDELMGLFGGRTQPVMAHLIESGKLSLDDVQEAEKALRRLAGKDGSEMISLLANHLWQSTLFAIVAGVLTFVLRHNHARLRHSLWLAASLKFLVPFALLVSAGSHLQWSSSPAAPPRLSIAVQEISTPFAVSLPRSMPLVPVETGSRLFPLLLLIVWLGGSVAVFLFWCSRWRRVRRTVRTASPLDVGAPIRTRSSAALLEPGIFGVFRPILLLPEGISQRLTPAQLQAVSSWRTNSATFVAATTLPRPSTCSWKPSSGFILWSGGSGRDWSTNASARLRRGSAHARQ